MRKAFRIGGVEVPAGARRLVDLPVSRLSNHTPITLPVHVMHGDRPGPVMFLTAAVHGDELNGVEIIRRVLRTLQPGNLAGTLLSVPVVNAYGFIGRSRYLPDRRDLNRSFPGSPNGSLAARLAHLLLSEVVKRSQFGIDLHTAAIHRVNLPQIRCSFERSRARKLAQAFATQVVLDSPERPGSLRKAAQDAGVEVLVYEGGEGLRFDEFAIKAGVDGVAGVMLEIGMLELPESYVPPAPDGEQRRQPVFANASKWVRAPEGGVLRTWKRIGDAVGEGEVIGQIANPYEEGDVEVRSPRRGIIIGRTTLPIVNMGDALFHIAWPEEAARSPARRAIPRESASEPIMDEDEII
jgi:predicted deacylase